MTPEELRAMRRGERPQIFQPQGQLTDGSGGGTMAGQPMSEQQMMAMEQMYNPMMNMGGSPDIRRVEKWLETKIPTKDDKQGLWLTETTLIEELTKSNLSSELANWCFREWREIVALAGGDGNEWWIADRQNNLLFFIKVNRSVNDRAEKGLRDGVLLMTQNINQKSDVKMPQEVGAQRTGGGFFGFFGGGNK